MGPSPQSRGSTGIPVRAGHLEPPRDAASWGGSNSRARPAMTKVQDSSAANSTMSLRTCGSAPHDPGQAGSVM